MSDSTERRDAPQPFDFSRAVQRPFIGPHFLHEDANGNQCLWIYAAKEHDDFLLNVAAHDAYLALPGTGVKYVRFKGTKAKVDIMFPLALLRIDLNNTFPGSLGLSYRVNLEKLGPVAFTPPQQFIPF